MLRMDGFDVAIARTPAEALALRAETPDSAYIAGGTDLLPNLKHRIAAPKRLIALGAALPHGWWHEGDDVVIGAGTRLTPLTSLRELAPLAAAAGLVAGPQIRNMGTLGGNVLLDTRCLYYNQTAFWRKSLGYCLKAEGSWCHVVGGPKTCVAAQSSDTVPVLLACNARIRLQSLDGTRELSLRELFRFDGMNHLKIEPSELLTHVLVPRPPKDFRGSYQKLRTRGSIDFPMLGLAIAGRFDGDVPLALDIVVGAVNPQPKPVRGLDGFLGRALDDSSIDEIAELVLKQTRPQGSVAGEPSWRRHMAGVYTRRGLQGLRDAAP